MAGADNYSGEAVWWACGRCGCRVFRVWAPVKPFPHNDPATGAYCGDDGFGPEAGRWACTDCGAAVTQTGPPGRLPHGGRDGLPCFGRFVPAPTAGTPTWRDLPPLL